MKQLPSLSKIFLVLTLGGLLYILFPWIQLRLEQNPGYFHRRQFDAIVNEVRASGIQPGEVREYRLDNLSDPKSIRPRKDGEYFDRGEGAGNVAAVITEQGELKVVIETRDLGHAGEYGFAFSDLPLTPEPSDLYPEALILDVPGINRLHGQIDSHWWKVESLLD